MVSMDKLHVLECYKEGERASRCVCTRPGRPWAAAASPRQRSVARSPLPSALHPDEPTHHG